MFSKVDTLARLVVRSLPTPQFAQRVAADVVDQQVDAAALPLDGLGQGLGGAGASSAETRDWYSCSCSAAGWRSRACGTSPPGPVRSCCLSLAPGSTGTYQAALTFAPNQPF
jgi:hypothetical protein